jgi:hypothetical protein
MVHIQVNTRIYVKGLIKFLENLLSVFLQRIPNYHYLASIIYSRSHSKDPLVPPKKLLSLIILVPGTKSVSPGLLR